MTGIATAATDRGQVAEKALRLAAGFWFLAALVGQWIFVYYVALHYGGSALAGDFGAWGKSSLKGFVPGDSTGNLVFGAHVLMAATLTFGGTLQLFPQIRKHALNFHRWNGRVFVVSAIAISLGGLYLVWVRDASTTLLGSVSISLNAALIMVFAVLAIRNARAGAIATHRQWALRAFLAVNGVWFFRVGLMGWIILNQGPVGVGENLDGPVVMVLNFACYLLPLAILEIYFLAQRRASSAGRAAVAAMLVILTLLMAVGIFAAFLFMWKPLMA